jgi:predicted nucleic acid-binding protein
LVGATTGDLETTGATRADTCRLGRTGRMRPSEADLAATLAPLDFMREALPFSAAYEAGRAYLAYRKAGGVRERTLPDFFIGAHAMVKSYRLLTRDAQRYRGYFPSLDIISPETQLRPQT